jgi:uncharacterized membrane protein YeaQ/YmgE (transglycosylase-associated protein family)
MALDRAGFRMAASVFTLHQGLGGPKMLSFIGAIIIGLLAGLVAKLIMPGHDPGGIIVTILLGIAGALAATYLGQAVGWYGPDQKAGFIGAVVGAIIILLGYRMFLRRSR